VRIITLVDNICGSASPPTRLVKMLNRPDRQFMAEQGLSIIIEMENGQRVLFDTGSSEEVFLHNLHLLGLEPKDFNAVVISHGHYDHVGGLVPLIEAGVPIFAHPKTFIGKRYSTAGEAKTDISVPQRVIDALAKAKLNLSTQSVEVIPGIRTSGEIARSNDFEQTLNFIRDDEGRMLEDTIHDEQAIYITTKRGLVIISGCSHSGIVNIVTQAKKQTPGARIHMVIGGLHMMGASQDRIRKTMEMLKNLNVDRIAPLHCTGFEAMKMISDRFVGFELMPSGSEIELL
jgi:7,8-dihydropterin-6-yl-methyl-4-(beta-D-ribofuranosyl)aminobenzene 5'-phosphate synthase